MDSRDLSPASAGQTDLDVEVAVIGAGLTGAATAWELTRRGHSVALIERFGVGHQRGSSHGSSRIYRRAYLDPLYIQLTGAVEEGWQELEREAGRPLRTRTGGLDHGAGRQPARLAQLLTDAGVPHELLTSEAATERWPGMRFNGPVLHHPDAGTLDPDATIATFLRLAQGRGLHVLTDLVMHWVEHVAGRVRVDAESTSATAGATVTADRVVLAVGAWLPELAECLQLGLDGAHKFLPPLVVTQQQIFHFPILEPGSSWPIFLHNDVDQNFGLLSGSDGGPAPAMKVGFHDPGIRTTADTRSGLIDPVGRNRLIEYVRNQLPGLNPEPVAEATCLYTWTDDEDFVLDRVGNVVIASPCSGHGAKFAPLLGSMVADLALGGEQQNPRFALRGSRTVADRSATGT